MPPKLALRSSSRPWVATQTGFKERLSPRPLKIPGSFTARYRSLAIFQQLRLLPQNPAAARFLPVGLQTARKDTRFSTSPFSVIFESGHSFLIRNLTVFDLKNVMLFYLF
ncbi:hypothetical protein KWG64_16195 [Rahnella sp. PD12R]|uniref:hypothetical protein n=1 Tax=Rahnella sp. PD12R TaxID=2855688 RepID=UPI001C457C78|nr:hypothetical protein [Rahnella sp. PD12R]MBV6819482.1 hypothetical protein [Rahnella sp. PD12R]